MAGRGGGKKGSICMLRHASRTNGKRALALDRDEKEKRAEKGNKDESVRNTFAVSAANLEEFDD